MAGLTLNESRAQLAMPPNLPGSWNAVGRAKIQAGPDSVVIQGGYVAADRNWRDEEVTVRMRAPAGTEQVELWGGFRYRDRDSRYVFALRGGNNDELYLARYAPDGGSRFLGFAALGFHPLPGEWYRLRLVILGKRFQIYLNDETLPRINVVDSEALWTEGSMVLGGGWLPEEYADLHEQLLTTEARTAALAIGDKTWAAAAPDKEAMRKAQRAGYTPAKINAFNSPRTEISLDGDWLFMPDYQLTGSREAGAAQCDDSNWHVMEVPRFWTPGLSWLHGETGFPDLKGPAITKGVADSLYVREMRRVESYTFNWRKTKAAWYRHYVELPDNLNGRRFELTFDAIAKIADVWVNGIKVGTHTGMFGQVRCDVTKALKPGRNVVAVHVISEADSPLEANDTVEGVAVTVEVTSRMLHSLPHGMLQDDVGGIWQPVKLTATAPVWVNDAFIKPSLSTAGIDLEILNATGQPAKLDVDYTITSARDQTILYTSDKFGVEISPSGETTRLRLTTPRLNPKLWSPEEPNLYNLEVRLSDGKEITDRYLTRFGFRTFTKDGNRFLLNGRPYWLRGANPFPNTLCPNDGAVARRFMEIAREGNVRVTRSHIVPFSSTWLDAADEVGMAVSFEGTWPWLMLKGEPPGEQLLKVWKDEFLSLIREHRNHPSLILWTVNNEMKFPVLDANDPERLKAKWRILDDMIRAMRVTDPTRPIVADSAYSRKEAAKSYRMVVQPGGFDDGDVDDVHAYYGWYNPSFFHYYNGEFAERYSTTGRPLISQEMATGYPRSEDGHAARFYLFKHYTPQAFVGDDAYENADPAIFLSRQAFMTKELAETFRRTSHDSAAGILHFSYFTWFKMVWAIDGMQPWPAYYGLKRALQPVLVSAELYGRHFYSGRSIQRRVCVINDAENGQALPATELRWEFRGDGKSLSRGWVHVPPVNYYSNCWMDVNLETPKTLPAPRVDGQLILSLESDGTVLSENSYDVVLATDDWASGGGNASKEFLLIDPSGQLSKTPSGIPLRTAETIDGVKTNGVVVISDAESFLAQPTNEAKVRSFVSRGGRVLLLHPKSSLARVFPQVINKYVDKEGEIVTIHVPESTVFSQIEPLDLAWFERGDRRLPLACTGVYQLLAVHPGATALAEQCDIHAYLHRPSDVTEYTGTPLVDIQIGGGRVIASELNFEARDDDPIAGRVLSNVLRSLASNSP